MPLESTTFTRPLFRKKSIRDNGSVVGPFSVFVAFCPPTSFSTGFGSLARSIFTFGCSMTVLPISMLPVSMERYLGSAEMLLAANCVEPALSLNFTSVSLTPLNHPTDRSDTVTLPSTALLIFPMSMLVPPDDDIYVGTSSIKMISNTISTASEMPTIFKKLFFAFLGVLSLVFIMYSFQYKTPTFWSIAAPIYPPICNHTNDHKKLCSFREQAKLLQKSLHSNYASLGISLPLSHRT